MANALTHRTLSSAIADRLRQSILGGEYAAGTQLRQDALAASFSVSRIPVREALFQLEAEGLVQIEPHKGAVVTGISMEEVDDVFDLRVALEARLLASSIPNLADSDFARIDAAREAFDRMVASGDISISGGLNAELHMAFYAGAKLPKTAAIVAGLLQTSDRYTRLQLSSTKGLAKAGREHRELAALCRKRDSAGALALLKAHIEAVRADLAAVLKRTPGLVAEGRASVIGRKPRS
jgi:DNA-binding GntR family transcriptional regulator